ncbi:TPA: hypothetical protein ACH3X3_003865 [Trebouxia sp. C0006]
MSTHSAEAGEDYYTEKSAAGRLFARGCSHGNITSSVCLSRLSHLHKELSTRHGQTLSKLWACSFLFWFRSSVIYQADCTSASEERFLRGINADAEVLRLAVYKLHRQCTS